LARAQRVSTPPPPLALPEVNSPEDLDDATLIAAMEDEERRLIESHEQEEHARLVQVAIAAVAVKAEPPSPENRQALTPPQSQNSRRTASQKNKKKVAAKGKTAKGKTTKKAAKAKVPKVKAPKSTASGVKKKASPPGQAAGKVAPTPKAVLPAMTPAVSSIGARKSLRKRTPKVVWE
jgi:hypothetical protein